MATAKDQPAIDFLGDEPLCLTSQNFCVVSDGIVRDYVLNCDNSNVYIRSQPMDNGTDTLLRMNDLKDIQNPGPCTRMNFDEMPTTEPSENTNNFGCVYFPKKGRNDQDNVIVNVEFPVENDSEQIRNVTRILPESQSLPPGMLYHVFFSHANEDRSWVVDVMNKLESPAYGLKCCFADRDFDLGMPIFENITRCISASLKTVIVLSPEFLNSDWCAYEIRLTMEMDLDRKRRIMIPVMLRPCRVPEYIGRLTYIEVENDHFWDRFISAVRTEETDVNIITSTFQRSLSLSPLPYHHNMVVLAEITLSDCCGCGIGLERSNFTPAELTMPSTQLTDVAFQEILSTFKKVCYASCHGCYSRSLLCFCIWPVLVLAIYLIMYLCFDKYYSSHSDQRRNNAAINDEYFLNNWTALITFLVVLIILIRILMSKHAATKFTAAIKTANEISSRFNLMIGYRDYGCCRCQCDRFVILFYYYDWQLCKSHFNHAVCDARSSDEMLVSEISPENAETSILLGDVSSETASDISEEHTTTLLLTYVAEYVYLFSKDELLKPTEQRHTQQGECLCQFAESVEFDTEPSNLCKKIFGGKSRYSCERFLSFVQYIE